MQLITQVDTLLNGLSIVTRAIAPRSARAILEGVLMEASDNELILTCSDGSMTITTSIDADVKEGGRAVIPGRLLNDLVRKLPGGDVSVRVSDNGRATIQCMASRSNLNAMNADEFPEIAEEITGESVELKQVTLKNMISRTVFAIATDESRQILTGCLFERDGVELRMVALDGFRLALQMSDEGRPGDKLLKAVIPGRVLNEMSRILPDSEDLCTLVFDKGHMNAIFGRSRISSVLLAGEYIDYHRILPNSFGTEALVNRTEVANAIDRASLMAREGKNNLIRMKFSEDTLEITSNAEMGDVWEEMTAAVNGAPIEIAFNAKYLNDVIRAIGDDEMCMKLNTSVSPCVIVPKEGNEYLYLVLPVRVFQ